MSMKTVWVAGMLSFLSLVLPLAAAAEGDAAAGAQKAGLCAACHGPKGVSTNPLWPNIAGQQAPYLEKQMKAFRDGQRQEPTMQPFMATLTDQDIADLAAHYSGLGCNQAP